MSLSNKQIFVYIVAKIWVFGCCANAFLDMNLLLPLVAVKLLVQSAANNNSVMVPTLQTINSVLLKKTLRLMKYY